MDHDFTRFPEVVPSHLTHGSSLPEPAPLSGFHAELPATQEPSTKEPQNIAAAVGQGDRPQKISWIGSKKAWIAITVVLVVAVIVTGTTLSVLPSRKSKSKNENIAPYSSDFPSATASSGIQPSTVGVMSGTATIALPVPYPSPNAWPNQNYVLYYINPFRRVVRKWGDEARGWNPVDRFEDHGGLVSEIQPGVGVTMSGPAPEWPAWEDLTVVGSDNNIYRRRWNGTQFLPWLSLGSGDFATGPATTGLSDGREAVFIIGNSGELYTLIAEVVQAPQSSSQWRTNTTSGKWAKLQPATLRSGFNKLYIWLVSEDGSLWYQVFIDSTPGEFVNLGGNCTSRPAAVSWGKGNVSVFVRGGDGGLWWTTLTGASEKWDTWKELSNDIKIEGEPDVISISFSSVKLFVFALSSGGTVLWKKFDGVSWIPSQGMNDLNLTLAGPPKASSKAEGELQLFGYSADGRVLSKTYNETNGGWSEVIDFGKL